LIDCAFRDIVTMNTTFQLFHFVVCSARAASAIIDSLAWHFVALSADCSRITNDPDIASLDYASKKFHSQRPASSILF